MKTFLLLSVCTLTSFCLFSQGYKIGHRQITWIDSTRSKRSVTFEIYYPASTTADNVPIINNGNKFSLVVFGHGYQLTYKDYLWLKDSLVPKGFFLVFPRTEEKLFPSHTDFAKDIAFIVNRFDATKSVAGSWYYTRVRDQFCVGGHSMGGGCSLLSVQYSGKIRSVFNFAAAETNPSAIAASSNIKIPALIFSGGKDCVAPPSSNQLPMYNNIQNVCKTYVQINNTLHCQWSNNNSTCRLGEFFCSPSTSSPATTFAITFSLLYPWLNEFANSNNTAAAKFQQLLTTTTGITYLQRCAKNNKLSDAIVKESANEILAYPSVISQGELVHVKVPKLSANSVLNVVNQSGKIVHTEILTSQESQTVNLNSQNFNKGVCFITVIDGAVKYKSNILIE